MFKLGYLYNLLQSTLVLDSEPKCIDGLTVDLDLYWSTYPYSHYWYWIYPILCSQETYQILQGKMQLR